MQHIPHAASKRARPAVISELYLDVLGPVDLVPLLLQLLLNAVQCNVHWGLGGLLLQGLFLQL